MYKINNRQKITIKPNPKDPEQQQRLQNYIRGIFENAKMEILSAPIERLLYVSMRQVERVAQYGGAGYYTKQVIRNQLWQVVIKAFRLSEENEEHDALLQVLRDKFEAVIELGWSEPRFIKLNMDTFKPAPLQAHLKQM